jgi:hypothetical protein
MMINCASLLILKKLERLGRLVKIYAATEYVRKWFVWQLAALAQSQEKVVLRIANNLILKNRYF